MVELGIFLKYTSLFLINFPVLGSISSKFSNQIESKFLLIIKDFISTSSFNFLKVF